MEVNQDFLLTDDISFSAAVAFGHAPLGFLITMSNASSFRQTFWDMAERYIYIGLQPTEERITSARDSKR